MGARMSLDHAQELYESGMSLSAAASAVGMCRVRLRDELAQRGVEIRPRREKVLSPDQEAALLEGHLKHQRLAFEILQMECRLEELRAEKRKYTMRHMARMFGISPKTAWSIVQRLKGA